MLGPDRGHQGMKPGAGPVNIGPTPRDKAPQHSDLAANTPRQSTSTQLCGHAAHRGMGSGARPGGLQQAGVPRHHHL